MTKAEEKATKSAEKARLAAEKLQIALDKRTARLKEPEKDPLSEAEVEVPDEVELSDLASNRLGAKTKEHMVTIGKLAESTLNYNPPNIQDTLCQIIRNAMSAYSIHVGRPFDTDLG